MNVIFLTMSPFDDLNVHNIYADLLNEFIAHGNKPYLVSPANACQGQKTIFQDYDSYAVLSVDAGDLGSSSLIKKGISTVMVEYRFLAAIKKYLGGVEFGLILYSTPPVTFAKVIRYLKKTQAAPTYLMLKDIFPQNAVDLGMFGENSLIHKYFRRKERKLYSISDNIGCMSQANVDYLLAHNRDIPPTKAHVLPNSIKPRDYPVEAENRGRIRASHGIPSDAVVFMYGGNMGKPQDIPFVVQCLRKTAKLDDCCFVMCGTGSEYHLLDKFVSEVKPSNVAVIPGLPKQEYDELLSACDVGLLFLDHRFTIPNFPSRMLSYMEQAKPVLACTDPNTDVGKVIINGGFGWWCESNDASGFSKKIADIENEREMLSKYGNRAREYLLTQYHVSQCYEIILQRMEGY